MIERNLEEDRSFSTVKAMIGEKDRSASRFHSIILFLMKISASSDDFSLLDSMAALVYSMAASVYRNL